MDYYLHVCEQNNNEQQLYEILQKKLTIHNQKCFYPYSNNTEINADRCYGFFSVFFSVTMADIHYHLAMTTMLTSCPANSGMYSIMANLTLHLVSSASSTMAGSKLWDNCLIPITCKQKLDHYS